MNKKVIYTCIIGDYDTLKEPLIVTEGWDYICFTDQDFKSDVWKIVKVGRSDVKEQRKKKIYNQYLLEMYKYSIWVDGSMYVNCDLNEFLYQNLEGDFTLMKHPTRNCTYQEAQACIHLDKDNTATIMQQLLDYKEKGFPANNGMVATGVMIRKHTIEVKLFCRSWWNEVFDHSKRDQLSFNYVAWRDNFEYTTIPFSILQDQFIITNHK